MRRETERLVLRSWHPDDAPRFAAALNTPEVTRDLGGVLAPADLAALFAKRLDDEARDGTCYWAVEWRASGELVASCGLRIARNYPGTPVEGMLEAGWRVGAEWQNRGIATEAMTAAIALGWETRAEESIGTWTRPENLASLALMRRLGFRRAQALDFRRPVSGETCLVHLLDRPGG